MGVLKNQTCIINLVQALLYNNEPSRLPISALIRQLYNQQQVKKQVLSPGAKLKFYTGRRPPSRGPTPYPFIYHFGQKRGPHFVYLT